MASRESKRRKGKQIGISKKANTRSVVQSERNVKKAEEVRASSRKRGRPTSYYPSQTEEGNDAKRKREISPDSLNTTEEEEEEEEERMAEEEEEEVYSDSDIDEEGETKIDKDGNLLGGRQYKIPTFTLPHHGNQQYMLAVEATKCLGYRDSYLFFHKNPSLKRIHTTDEEKKTLAEMGVLVSWFKNREVNIVTARSVFQLFGHKVIEKGRRHKDDYYTSHKKKTEHTEGENSRQSLIKKTSRSDGYYSAVPTDNKTWIHHAALATRGFNAQLNERRAGKKTFYDIHTHINQVPSSSQPASCRVELVKDQEDTVITFEKTNRLFRGVGQDILDYDPQTALDTLSDTQKETAKTILQKPSLLKDIVSDEDDNYPLAVMEGQFQAYFPIHQARFNYPIPKIPSSSAIADTAQSLAAQQYYLGLVYQSVNPYVDPQRQIPLPRPSPQYSLPPPIPRQVTQTPYVCGQMTHNQPCKRTVSIAGEKCPMHTAHTPVQTTQPSSDNRCADCHQLRADSSLFTEQEMHVTDDYALVKCSNCSRRYHPICANLTTPQQVSVVDSYPWLCPECKICCQCKTVGDESTLLICDGCDRGWHTTCCTPKVDQVPEGAWLCSFCAQCHGCGDSGIDKEYEHAIAPATDRYKYPVYLATYCHHCYANFKDDRFCTVCMKTYSDEDNDDDDNEMVACDTCDHWIHTRCDEYLTPSKYQKLCDDEDAKYSCPMCEDRIHKTVDTSSAELALKGLSAPCGYSVGLLGGKVKTRGVIKYKNIKVGVPEINGAAK